MPAGPTTWSRAFPEVYVALLTPEGREIIPPPLVAAFDRDRRLTAGESDYVREDLESRRTNESDTGARAWEAREIPNGEFSFDGQSFQIYTVQRGSLQGRRVIKVRDANGPGGWRAFAYVSRSGDFQLWARFRADEQAPYVITARSLVEFLGGSGAVSESIRHNGITTCLVCNAPVDFDNDVALELGVCGQHSPDADAPLSSTRVSETRPRRRRRVVSQSGNIPAGRGTPLPMCQLGTGEIQ